MFCCSKICLPALFALFLALWFHGFAAAQKIPAPESCHDNQSATVRLYCYDAVTGYRQGGEALDRAQSRAVADLAWATVAENRCSFMKMDDDTMLDLATEHGLGPDTMRPGSDLSNQLEKRFGMLEIVLGEDDEATFCLIALLLYGPEGAAVPNLLTDN